nr:immunoglobulin light chain junction region [Macaca mulatta]MOV75187.1 immunoglobulin light chain junction region [Macaca mulatta]MOV77422.1 immunoglobulin light chain junction region [Macaca mulatta]
CQQLDNSPYTF